MKTIHRVALASVVLAVCTLSGCIVERDHGPYSYERGDRIDRYGHREVGWCEHNHDDEHCR